MGNNVIAPSNTIPGAFGIRRNAGAPSAGTSEIQTLTIGGTPTGGTFRLKFAGIVTGPITWSATNATLLANIIAGLDAAVGTGLIVATATSLTAGIGTIALTFSAGMAKYAVPTLITVDTNSLTGTAPTLAIAEITPGVTATQRGIPTGGLLTDTTNGVLYENQGTIVAPTFNAQA